MKSKLILLLLLLILVSCAPKRMPIQSTQSPQDKLRQPELTVEERKQFDEAMAIADQLVEYDFYSWNASDILKQYLPIVGPKGVKGWIVIKENGASTVHFGKMKDSVFYSYFNVVFESTRTKVDTTELQFKKGSKEHLHFSLRKDAKVRYDAQKGDFNAPPNTYVLEMEDHYRVYFSPGSSNKHYIYGGGYCVTYDKNGAFIKDTKLHSSPIVMDASSFSSSEMFIRSSLQNDILNELDIAQFHFLKEYVPENFIATPKYMFHFRWDPVQRGVFIKWYLNEDISEGSYNTLKSQGQ